MYSISIELLLLRVGGVNSRVTIELRNRNTVYCVKARMSLMLYNIL
jgi:hypothetical protein